MGNQQTNPTRTNNHQQGQQSKLHDRQYTSEPNPQLKPAPVSARIEPVRKKYQHPPPKNMNCLNPLHLDEPLTMLCIDEACRNRSMLCAYCHESQHWNHQTVTLEQFSLNVKEMRNQSTTSNYVKNCIGSVDDLRKQFNSHLQNVQDKVTVALQELRNVSDGYLSRVETMLKGQQEAYEKLVKQEMGNEHQSQQLNLMTIYRKQADRLVECRHHRGQLVAQLDFFQKKISDEQKNKRRKIEQQSNLLVELCQQLQIAMEASAERFRYRQSSRLDPINTMNKSSWQQAIFQPVVKTNLSTDINQEQLETNPQVENPQILEVPMVIPKRKHVHPYRSTKPPKVTDFNDPEDMYNVVSQWSPTLRNANAYVSESGRKITRLFDSDDVVSALADTPLSQASLPQFIWTFKILRMSRKIAMGIRLAEKSKKLNHLFYQNTEDTHHSNGHYAVASDGWIYWREKQKHDMSQHKTFKFFEGQQIQFSYKLEDKRLEVIRDGLGLCSFDVRSAPVSDCYYPCVYLWDAEDCVEIVKKNTNTFRNLGSEEFD